MIHTKYIILLVIGALTLAWACKPASDSLGSTPDASNTSKEIYNALQSNDLASAKHAADALLSSSFDPDSIPVTDACVLAVRLMQLSQSAEDGDGYAAHALQCYQSVVRRDSTGARKFYETMSPEDFADIHLLRQLRSQVTARENGITVSEEYRDE